MAKPILGDLFIGNFPVTQTYGGNPEAYARFGLKGHNGIDFGTPTGTQIVSATDGEVIEVGFDQYGYGNYVKVLDMVQLCSCIYAHFDHAVVKVGQKVVRGQLLGLSDNTGNSTGPHLHFGYCRVDENGVRTNKDNGYSGYINPNVYATWDIKNLTEPVTPATEQESLQAELDKTRSARDYNWNELMFAWSGLGLSGDYSHKILEERLKTVAGYEDQIRADEKKLKETQNQAVEVSSKLEEQKVLNTNLRAEFDQYKADNEKRVGELEQKFSQAIMVNTELTKEVESLKKQVALTPVIPSEFLEKNKILLIIAVATIVTILGGLFILKG